MKQYCLEVRLVIFRSQMAKCEVELLPLLEWQASLSLFG